jgi:multiple sugar transport system substrate-binding protein
MPRLTRRQALGGAGGLLAATALAACVTTEVRVTQVPAVKPTEPAKTGSTPTQSTPATSASVPPAGAVTVEYLNINNEAFGGPAVAELVKLFQEKNPSIKIDAQYVEGVYAGVVQKVQAGIAAKMPPATAQLGYNLLDFAATQLPHATLDKVPVDKTLAALAPSVRALGQVAGVQHGMPYSLSNPVLYVNVDMLKAGGVDTTKPPSTWDEVRDAAVKVKAKTDQFGLFIDNSADVWTTQSLIESNGGRLISEDRKTATFDSAEAVEAMTMWQDFANKLGVTPKVTQAEGQNSFLGGKVAMRISTIGSRATMESQSAGKFALTLGSFPTFGAKSRRVPGGGNTLFVFATDPKVQQAAGAWLEHLLSPEGVTIWTKGTGYVPLRQDALDDDKYLKKFMADNKNMLAATNQLKDTVSWVSFPGANGLQAEKVVVDARDEILKGTRPAREILTEAVQKANKLIAG